MMDPVVLNDHERALLAPALQRAAHHEAKRREALDEVGRLLAMRTGLPQERIRFHAATFTVEEIPLALGNIDVSPPAPEKEGA